MGDDWRVRGKVRKEDKKGNLGRGLRIKIEKIESKKWGYRKKKNKTETKIKKTVKSDRNDRANKQKKPKIKRTK